MDADRRECTLSDVKIKYEDDGDGSPSDGHFIEAGARMYHTLLISKATKATMAAMAAIVRGWSMANPRRACIVDLMLRKLKDAGAAPNQIAVLCGYKAQLRVFETLPSKLTSLAIDWREKEKA